MKDAHPIAAGPDPIRPGILENYYRHMFGKTAPGEEAFEGATFGEYHRLLRNTYWTVSREKAALRSKNPAFKALAGTFGGTDAPAKPAEGPKEKRKSAVLERLADLDLTAANLPDDLHGLFLDRVKRVSGFKRLPDLKALRIVEAVLCDTEEGAPGGTPLQLARIDLNDCGSSFVKTLLGMARAEWVRVELQDPPVFDLSLLKEYRDLRALFISSGLTLGARHLAGLPLETLWLTNVQMDSEFREALASIGKALKQLKLANETPFGPDALPEMPGLEKLVVHAYPEFKEAWIRFALAHPGTLCEFPPMAPPAANIPKAKVAEIHKGVDILEMSKGVKVWYEVWGDLAARIQGDAISNNELRDRLEETAGKCKPKVKLSSEGDELRMSSTSLESLKACLDGIP